MEKKLLIERNKQVSGLKFTEAVATEGGSKRLGHLAGIGADLVNPTRNGRKYPVELWQKVLESDDFKEMMETHTCFCENDHPSEESGRIDTSIKEVSAVLTKMEIREDEGIVWTEFDILDTPQGRILKSLVDYGSIIGVSSRGLGEEIQRNGETIIDPDTYAFYGFDMVLTPAVLSARQQATESLNKKKASVVESFTREIREAKTVEEVNSIKRIAESTNLPNMDAINEAVDAKLKSSEEDNIYVAKLESNVSEIAKENEKLKRSLRKACELLEANNIRLRKAKSELKDNDSVIESFKEQLSSSNAELNKLKRENVKRDCMLAETESKVILESKQVEKLNDQTNVLTESNKSLDGRLSRVLEENKRIQENNRRRVSALETDIDNLNSKLSKTQSLNEKLIRDNESSKRINENLQNRNIALNKQLKDLKEQLENSDDELSYAKKLLEEKKSEILAVSRESKLTVENVRKQATQRITEVNRELDEAKENYLITKCAVEGVDSKDVRKSLPKKFTIEDINTAVKKLSDQKKKMNALPYAINEFRTGTISLSESKVSDEDFQTLHFLNGDMK